MSALTDWVYTHSPVWVQNAGISLYGLQYRHERLAGDFHRHVREYREREDWPRGRIEDYVQEQLSSVLLGAGRHVPYYRERWAAAGWTQSRLAKLTVHDLWRLPITPKADLRSKPETFVSETAGPLRKLHRYYTSGSTGTPITVYCTSGDHRRFIAAREARSFGWADVSVRAPRSMLGGRPIVPRHDAPPPFYRRNWAERQVYFSAYHISRAHAANYVEGFNRYRPQVLTGYAHAHYLLAQFMLAEGLRLDYRPEALILSSEPLTPVMRETLGRAFCARPYEEYGAVENCMLATECPEGRLHANPDYGWIEIVDDEGRPLPPGQVGRVVCTGFAGTAQPLVRYDIGDLAAWSAHPCPCGRGAFPVLGELVGRMEDVVVGRNGHTMVRFHGLFVNLPNVLEGQLIQESLDRIRVRVVATDGFGADDARVIHERLCRERLGDVETVIERVPNIERTERGKFRSVISLLPKEVLRRAADAAL